MIEERQPLRAHKISLSNRSLGVITGVKDVVSFDLNEIILDTDQGLLMIKGKNLHVKKLLVEKSFYSGSFSFDYGSKECRFVASIVIYRSKECLPEGDADRIDDLVPVWWEFHTSDQAGERPNDFSFSELKEYLF